MATGKITEWWLGNDGLLHTFGSATTIPLPPPPPGPKVVVKITSQQDLTVSMSASGSSATAPATIASYAWDWGDGAKSTGVTASRTYLSPGTYTVTVVATDTNGQTGKATQSVTVTAPAQPKPTGNFTVSGTGLARSFAGTSSADPTATYAWNFGDGGAGTGANTSHTYAKAGTVTVTLVITDSLGTKSDPITKQVTVTAPNTAPTVSMNLTTSGATSTAVLTGFDADGDALTYSVNWGDGATTSGTTSSHTYTAVGPWTVVATVTDSKGAQGTDSKVANPVINSTGSNGDSGVNQTGVSGKQQSGGTPYASASGSTVQDKVTSAGVNGISFPTGVFEWSKFSGSGTSGKGISFPNGVKSILGAGSASTILRMTANSDTGHSNMSSGTTGLFDTYIVSPADGFVMDGINLQGTPQGNLLYHGMQIDTPGNSTISNCTISGMPGNSGSPPGETFGLSIHQQAAGKTFLVKNTTFDGKQAATGQNVGAAIAGTNTTRGIVTFQDVLFQNAGHSAGLALWEIVAGGTVNLIRPVFKNNWRNLGNEAQGGTINIYDPIMYDPTNSGEDDIRITWTSGYNSASINLYFTSQKNLDALFAVRTRKKLSSQTSAKNSTNYGSASDLQPYTGPNLIKNFCHMFVAGSEIDKTPYWTFSGS